MGEDTDMCYFINWNWIITWWYGEKKKSINKLIFLHNLLEIGKTIKDECDVLGKERLFCLRNFLIVKLVVRWIEFQKIIRILQSLSYLQSTSSTLSSWTTWKITNKSCSPWKVNKKVGINNCFWESSFIFRDVQSFFNKVQVFRVWAG